MTPVEKNPEPVRAERGNDRRAGTRQLDSIPALKKSNRNLGNEVLDGSR